MTADILDNDEGIGVYRFDSGPYRTDPYFINHDTEEFQKESGYGQNLRFSYTGKNMRFLSVTGYRDYSNENLQDYDVTADAFNNWGAYYSEYDNSYLSQEFRLSSVESDSPFNWLTGVHGFMEKTDVTQYNEVVYRNTRTAIETSGYAVFGEVTYTFFNRLHLTAGFRYDAREIKEKNHENTAAGRTIL